MSPRTNNGTRNKGGKKKGNKNTRKNTPIPTTKTIDDYLKDNIFPIRSNEYITIELETCKEGNENPIYNYKVSDVNKKAFTQDVPDYNEYPTLTMETLQEGINKLELKTPNSFIRLMLISGNDGLKIWKLDNQQYKPNTNNFKKCGYGTPIYEELIPMAYDADSFVEQVVLEPTESREVIEEQPEQIDLPKPKISTPDFKSESDDDEPDIEAESDDNEPDIESESDDEESLNKTWHTTEPNQALLNMIDEISNQVEEVEYEDDKSEITQNMEMLKELVDELNKISNFLTPKDTDITDILGKSKCNIALNYIKDNRDEDYKKVDTAYNTYINYQTSWLSDKFEDHKKNFIEELENFKTNLIEKVYSTFEYGDSEYCQNKSTNNDDELIKLVENAKINSGVGNKPIVNPPQQNATSYVDENYIKQFKSLDGFIREAKQKNMNLDSAFSLYNKGKPHSQHERKDKFSSHWGGKTPIKRTTRSTKQKSNKKTLKTKERKNKSR
tara:strand:+ start:3506 stop:5002 length:1497 start_codon:yes stop_codon:yes gene_type:complete